MSNLLNISEAASLAMHAMVWLATKPEKRWSVRHIAESMNVSANHLAKVMQRLEKAELVQSVRGPKGGFSLKVQPESISLLMVYEVIEGPMTSGDCMLGNPVCKPGNCIFDGHFNIITEQVREYLSKKRLSDLNNSLNIGE